MRLAGVLIATSAALSAVACGSSSDEGVKRTRTPIVSTITVVATVAAERPEPTATATAVIANETPSAVASTPATQGSPTSAATKPPPAPTQPPPQPATASGISLTVVAVNTAFSPTRLSAPSGATLTLTLDNQDPAILHNFVLFDPSGTQIAETELFEGPGARSVTFPAPGPGSYPFTCTVHPRDMRGTLTAQ